MISFYDANYSLNDIWKTATTFATLFKGVEDHCRHDQTPRILIKKAGNDLFDLALRDHVAMANKHAFLRPDANISAGIHTTVKEKSNQEWQTGFA